MTLTDRTRAVLFDLDGTLLDHEAARDAGILAMLSSTHDLTEDEKQHYVAVWRENSEQLYMSYLAGEITFEQQRLHRILRFAEIAEIEIENDDAAWALFHQYQREYEHHWQAFDDVVPTIARLRELQIPFAVVTNGPGEQQNAKVERLGLSGTPVIASGELDFSKPDPRIFEVACRTVGHPAEACLMVGDNPTADVIGAQQAGLSAVLIERYDLISPQYAHLPAITTLGQLFI